MSDDPLDSGGLDSSVNFARWRDGNVVFVESDLHSESTDDNDLVRDRFENGRGPANRGVGATILTSQPHRKFSPS